jgi:hypothetical protein
MKPRRALRRAVASSGEPWGRKQSMGAETRSDDDRLRQREFDERTKENSR